MESSVCVNISHDGITPWVHIRQVKLQEDVLLVNNEGVLVSRDEFISLMCQLRAIESSWLYAPPECPPAEERKKRVRVKPQSQPPGITSAFAELLHSRISNLATGKCVACLMNFPDQHDCRNPAVYVEKHLEEALKSLSQQELNEYIAAKTPPLGACPPKAVYGANKTLRKQLIEAIIRLCV